MKKTQIIKTYYEENIGKNLPDYLVLGWESEEAQRLRFDTLVSSVNIQGKRILDVGCGLGNLLEYINESGIEAKYTGVDILQSMVDRAKEKGLNADFRCVNIFKDNPFKKGSFDIVYASGIFNLNLGNNRDFLFDALKLFLELSDDVVAFNLLTSDSPEKEDRYFYFDPDEVVKIIKRVSSKITKINIIKHYLQNDFTVVCSK